ncbi:MAG: transcriptional repressor [Armatimonadetes bacterium]|nr:transcriptional repressor [Armatimonadota bacterium]
MKNDTGDHQTHRHTHQREIILEELCKLDSHPTVDDLFLIVRKRLPHIGLATVYRNLELLAEQGVIQKLELAGHPRRFDGWAQWHTHIRCLNCGAVADVDIEPRRTPLEEVQEHTDYRVTDQHIEFVGECPRCQKSATAREA